jgi:hypothetical protein
MRVADIGHRWSSGATAVEDGTDPLPKQVMP